MKSNKFRWAIVFAAVLAGLYGLLPTAFDMQDGKLDGEFPPAESEVTKWVEEHDLSPLTLGLDLQGGLLLQYHVLVERAVQDKLDRMARDLEIRVLEKHPDVQLTVKHPAESDYIEVNFPNAADKDKLDEDVLGFFQSLKKVDMQEGLIHLVVDENYVKETKEFAISQGIETIRERVDALGVSEPSITRQGTSDIVVQLPGLKEDDVERAKRLIGQTAQLQFRMVDDAGTNAFFNQFSGKLPEGFQLRVIGGGYRSVTHKDKEPLLSFFEGKVDEDHMVGFEHHPIYKDALKTELDDERSYYKSYYVTRKVELTGDYVQEARVAIDQQFNRPYVALNFDSKGAQLFGDLSGSNVGKRMAIMLDTTIKSAPVFNEAIPGGRAQITMGGMQSYNEILADAEDLVIVLRHGALPAPIEKQFETVVGPSLGQDSIDSSILAFGVGMLLVVLFMLGYYKFSGIYSVIALTMNMLFIVAALAAIGATLTLPGIAGIILTIGMAVDANVIIYERIREELGLGRTAKEAVNAGFEKAFSAVMDANVTTGIAGLVLLQYGTGPIRGFAVTLLIGIISTIFTAVFFTRLMFDTKIPGSAKDTISI
jgi:protein-export membrane protein SecD